MVSPFTHTLCPNKKTNHVITYSSDPLFIMSLSKISPSFRQSIPLTRPHFYNTLASATVTISQNTMGFKRTWESWGTMTTLKDTKGHFYKKISLQKRVVPYSPNNSGTSPSFPPPSTFTSTSAPGLNFFKTFHFEMREQDSITERGLLPAATALRFCYYCYCHEVESLITITGIEKMRR